MQLSIWNRIERTRPGQWAEVAGAAGNLLPQPVEPLTHLYVGSLDEAGLAIAAARDPAAAIDEFMATMDRVMQRAAGSSVDAGNAPGGRAVRRRRGSLVRAKVGRVSRHAPGRGACP